MHILGQNPLGKKRLIELFLTAENLKNTYYNLLGGKSYLKSILEGHTIALLFLEPSTRTRVSFQLAAKVLGAETILLSENTSAQKGETLEDTIRTLANYPQISAIVLRSSEIQSAQRAVKVLEHMKSVGRLSREISIINAGDGSGFHPTQAFLDLYTLWRYNKLYDVYDCGNAQYQSKRLCGVIFGDVAKARALHSLVLEISVFRPVIYVYSPPRNQLPWKIYKKAAVNGAKIRKISRFEDKIAQTADFYYFIRYQKERHLAADGSYFKEYGCSSNIRNLARKDAIFLHPGPMLKEMPQSSRWDERFKYDQQIENGMWIRAALFKMLLACSQENI